MSRLISVMGRWSVVAAITLAAILGVDPLQRSTISTANAEEPMVQVIDPQALLAHQYFYGDFPRQWQALQNERQYLEAELRALQLRSDSYRPFRSFHQYGATYTADMGWQLELLAARQRLACLANAEADLWRQRQAAAQLTQ